MRVGKRDNFVCRESFVVRIFTHDLRVRSAPERFRAQTPYFLGFFVRVAAPCISRRPATPTALPPTVFALTEADATALCSPPLLLLRSESPLVYVTICCFLTLHSPSRDKICFFAGPEALPHSLSHSTGHQNSCDDAWDLTISLDPPCPSLCVRKMPRSSAVKLHFIPRGNKADFGTCATHYRETMPL